MTMKKLTQKTNAPIVCSLDAAGLAERIRDFRALAASQLIRAQRTHDGGRILFRNSDGAADRIGELFALEKECCSFFDFIVELVDDTIRVTVKAPEQAAAFVKALLENFSKPTARPASAADLQRGDRSVTARRTR